MKYCVRYSTLFKRSFKKCLKRGCNPALFEEVVAILAETGTLPERYRPHKLSGKYSGYWECHITPDWLLIWEQNNKELILLLVDTGSHSDLFR